ncbi:MAG TPA: hypothetical protein VFZ81_05675, partial [Burkholderiales bacterium]
EALRASHRLTFRHELHIATLDDATPNAAVLSVTMEGYPEPIIIDYVAAIIGLDSRAIAKSAISVEFEKAPLRVLHPIQLLEAKIWNLYSLEAKRTPQGIEQARLAIEIAAAFVDQARMSPKDLLRAVEVIARFAATVPARYAREHFDMDCLKAIPASVFREGILPPLFREKRWPQLAAAAGQKSRSNPG